MAHQHHNNHYQGGDWPTDYELDNARIHERATSTVTRRHVLKLSGSMVGVAALGAGVAGFGSVRAQSAKSTATEESSDSGTATTAMCVLTPELTEGPYYLDDLLVRSDITEGKAGIPFDLKITVLDSSTCQPLENVAVDIWHCDANGFYSGYTDKNPGGDLSYQDDGSNPDTFLRGVVLTDADGLAEFQTIYPGWYSGRDVHIHMKVHVGGATEDGTYDGGTTAHTGQLAFDDALTEQVATIEPYASRTTDFLRFEDDGVFGSVEEGDATFFVSMTSVNPDALSEGFVGTINVGVNPSADNSEGGSPRSPGGDPPGDGGDPPPSAITQDSVPR